MLTAEVASAIGLHGGLLDVSSPIHGYCVYFFSIVANKTMMIIYF